MALYRELNLATVSTSSSANSADLTTFSGDSSDSQGGCRALLNVTAVVTSVDVTVRGVVNGRSVVVGTFAQKTTTGNESIDIPHCPRVLDTDYTIVGGTATFTVDIVRF